MSMLRLDMKRDGLILEKEKLRKADFRNGLVTWLVTHHKSRLDLNEDKMKFAYSVRPEVKRRKKNYELELEEDDIYCLLDVKVILRSGTKPKDVYNVFIELKKDVEVVRDHSCMLQPKRYDLIYLNEGEKEVYISASVFQNKGTSRKVEEKDGDKYATNVKVAFVVSDDIHASQKI